MGDSSWPRTDDTVALAAFDPRRIVRLRLSPDGDTAGFDQPETFSVVEDVHAGDVALTGVRIGPLRPVLPNEPLHTAVVAPKGDAVATTALLTDALHAFGAPGWDNCAPCVAGTEEGRATLAGAGRLVLNVLATIDAIYAATLALDWMQRSGFGALVDDALVIIHQVREEESLTRFTNHFQRRCRAVVLVPSDPLIEAGVAAAFDELRPATQTSYWQVVEHLASPWGDRRQQRAGDRATGDASAG